MEITSRTVVRVPPATLYTSPGVPTAAAASVAETTSSTYVKSLV